MKKPINLKAYQMIMIEKPKFQYNNPNRKKKQLKKLKKRPKSLINKQLKKKKLLKKFLIIRYLTKSDSQLVYLVTIKNKLELLKNNQIKKLQGNKKLIVKRMKK